jgi:hypothetical protein
MLERPDQLLFSLQIFLSRHPSYFAAPVNGGHSLSTNMTELHTSSLAFLNVTKMPGVARSVAYAIADGPR